MSSLTLPEESDRDAAARGVELAIDEAGTHDETPPMQIPEKLARALRAAIASGRYAIAITHIDPDPAPGEHDIQRHWTTEQFPLGQLVPFAEYFLDEMRRKAKVLPDERLPDAGPDLAQLVSRRHGPPII